MRVAPAPVPRDDGGAGADGGGRPDHAAGVLIRPGGGQAVRVGRGEWDGAMEPRSSKNHVLVPWLVRALQQAAAMEVEGAKRSARGCGRWRRRWGA
eukprot:3139099-Prymnesium_polylepis.1